MNYIGKLYGKFKGKYFDTGHTSDEFDRVHAKTRRHTQYEIPKDGETVGSHKYSVTVIAVDEFETHAYFYSHFHKQWQFEDGEAIDESAPRFTWYYKPNYMTYND